MDGRQAARQDGAEPSTSSSSMRKTESALELGEKMKKIDMRPPSAPSPTLSLLAKNTALLPSGIVRVKQLRDAALNQPPVNVAGPSSAVASGSATGNPRNKTALAPGHSLMDWIRLGSSGVDLTGVGGRLLTVTPAELARHNKANDAWIAIRGIVFNVSRYMSFHPGGMDELMKGVGKDATKLFDDVHAWVNYQSILQKCIVGRLERSVNVDLYLESDKDKPKDNNNGKNESATEPVPKPPALRMDWRQTTNTVSFYYTAPADNPAAECQIRKLNDTDFAFRVCFEGTGDVVTHNVELAEDVDWPPNWQRNSETAEIELSFRKKNRCIWKKYGTLSTSHEKIDLSKRTYNEYEVLENTPLCKVVHLLVLRAQNYIQLVPPGRHVEAKMNVMGTEVSRLYTPVPNWLEPEDRPASIRTDDCLCLMVKRYEDGAMSPRLVTLQPGDTVTLSNSLGDFSAESYDGHPVIHLLAAGSGLTVMLSIIKRSLGRRNPPSLNLINFNRSEEGIFYAQQLDRVCRERTLKVTHVLSEAADESTWAGRTGGVSEELLKDLMAEHLARGCVFTCGPAGFMKAARESLLNLGWQPSQMHEFDG